MEEIEHLAEEELTKVGRNPAEVNKAGQEAEGVLGRYVDRQEAQEVTNEGEKAFEHWAEENRQP